MFKFFKKNKEIEESKEEVVNVHEKELAEEQLEQINNFGSERYKETLEEKQSDELTEEQLDKMSYDHYHDDKETYTRK